jgi:hypothetical protein
MSFRIKSILASIFLGWVAPHPLMAKEQDWLDIVITSKGVYLLTMGTINDLLTLFKLKP